MSNLDDAIWRSTLIEERIRQRTDVSLRDWLSNYEGNIDYLPLDELMISEDAWNHVQSSGVDTRMVLAHPVLLCEHPPLSAYYRGIALLSQKSVSDLVASVASWENPEKKPRVTEERSRAVSQLYNLVISSIIEGATDWTLENGYRNIIANMGITIDGSVRNLRGRIAEKSIQDRIGNWLHSAELIESYRGGRGTYQLPKEYCMRYGSEPDIEFTRGVGSERKVVATIEIKGGKDPAAALERLGAMRKSFEETPAGCTNVLISGVITPAMAKRLDEYGVTLRYLLDDLVGDTKRWAEFLNEIFHHVIRITDSPITEEQIAKPDAP